MRTLFFLLFSYLFFLFPPCSKLAMVYHCIGCESFHFQSIGKCIEEGKSLSYFAVNYLKILLKVYFSRRKYPPATGPPIDRQCNQCTSTFRVTEPNNFTFVNMMNIHSLEDQFGLIQFMTWSLFKDC